MKNRVIQWCVWPAAIALVVGITGALWYQSQPRRSDLHAAPRSADDDTGNGKNTSPPGLTRVKVVIPRAGALERVTTQVGSVQGESVQLHAKVTGYLKSQFVDIGSRVKKGQVLAVVDVPELEKTVEKNAATVELYQARVAQMKAKVKIANADVEASNAHIV